MKTISAIAALAALGKLIIMFFGNSPDVNAYIGWIGTLLWAIIAFLQAEDIRCYKKILDEITKL
jgi:FtsH-binding integral membrane protein